MTEPHYKRGTIRKDGKLYGRYPDGSLYRIYSTTDRPFLQLVDVDGETFLRTLLKVLNVLNFILLFA